jgi:hypothetical protein
MKGKSKVKGQRASMGRMSAFKLALTLEALKDEKRQLQKAIEAIETARRKRNAGPEPPKSVN